MKALDLKKALDTQANNQIVSVVDMEEKSLLESEQEDKEITNENLVLIEKVVSTLVDTKDIDIKTDFKRNEIILFQQVEILAELFKIPVLKDFCEGVKRKKLSIDRGLRKELVQAVMQVQNSLPNMSDMDMGFPYSMGRNMKG